MFKFFKKITVKKIVNKKRGYMVTSLIFADEILEKRKLYDICTLLNINGMRLELYSPSPEEQQEILNEASKRSILISCSHYGYSDMQVDLSSCDKIFLDFLSKYSSINEFNLFDLSYPEEPYDKGIDYGNVHDIWINYNGRESDLVDISIIRPLNYNEDVEKIVSGIESII